MGHGMATPPVPTDQTSADSGSVAVPPTDQSPPAPAGSQVLAVAGPSQPRRRAAPARKRSNRCATCGKTFSSPGKLAQHQYTHTGERPFRCQRCDKSFSSKFKLMRHVLTHNKERQFQCSECNKGFYRKDHLKNHMETHNPNKLMFQCQRPSCGKEYTSSTGLKKHSALHEAEDGNLVCTLCGVTFQMKHDIIFHLKTHAGSRTVKSAQDKKFQCDVCNKRFFTRKDVKRHLVVHTGTRDFVCVQCPQKFGRKDHLVRHIKKSHSSVQGATLRRGRIKTEPTTPGTPGSPGGAAAGDGAFAAPATPTAASAASAASSAAGAAFSTSSTYYSDEGGSDADTKLRIPLPLPLPPQSQQEQQQQQQQQQQPQQQQQQQHYQQSLADMDLSDPALLSTFDAPDELPDLSAILRSEAYGAAAAAAEMFYLSRPSDHQQSDMFSLAGPARPPSAGATARQRPAGGKDLSSLLQPPEVSEPELESEPARQRTPPPDDYPDSQLQQFRYFDSP